ncbi:MAG TPA: ABC transporter ATP-binding protein [Actinomycetes bacterium]|nr:ABC transporter ATP-binding protein [Actinomycetes bacterium]
MADTVADTVADLVTSPKPVRERTEVDVAPLAVETHGLTKRFGRQVAVDHIDLVVPRGSVYGFLGPNGSGKTTTIRMLLGLVSPTDGVQSLLGRPMPASFATVLPRVGALIEGPAFHPYLSGRANLVRLDAADRTVDPRSCNQRVDAALDRVGLAAAARKRYRAYSLGMRQRLGLAAAMLRPRELLVLDEPTNGLDPQGTREVRSLVRDLASDGTTVFVSSHLLAEVEQMCTHVGVMRTGRLVAQGTLESLGSTASARVRVDSSHAPQAAEILGRLGLVDIRVVDNEASAELGSARPEDVTEALVLGGVPVRQLLVDRPHLEELFVSLTGEGFDVDE